MDKFIVNIIHRPEMVPEYSATVTGQGKEEDIGDKALLTESLDIFKTQQRLAHENGLKVTIQMTYASLFNDEAVEIAKHDIMFCDLNRFIVKQRSICHLNGNFQAILMCQSLLCLENIERLCK